MSTRLHPPHRVVLDDEKAEQVRQSHQRAIEELQALPLVRGKLIRGIELPDGSEVTVAHGLGHRASLFPAIPLQGNFTATNGRLLDITLLRTDKVNLDKESVLKATGFGGTLTLDVWAV
jgi:hypothetical protein